MSPRQTWLTMHRQRHVAKHELTGGFVYALCGVIGRPSAPTEASDRCPACDLGLRANRSPNEGLARAA